MDDFPEASVTLARSQSAEALMSPSRITPLLVEYPKRCPWFGWNTELVITSDNSSIVPGFKSTRVKWGTDKDPKCHRLMRRSSPLINVSLSELVEREWMW
jgi:hypothetical protein